MKIPVIKNKVLVSWIFSYWLILICSLFASLLIYTSASQALSSEIEKVEVSVLRNTQNMVDARLAEITLTASLLQQDQDLRRFVHSLSPFYIPDMAISMADGKARMVQVNSNNLIIDNIYIHSLRSHITLSTQYGLNDDEGFALPTMATFGLDKEQFNDLIASATNRSSFVILPSPPGESQPMILLLYPVLGNATATEGVLIIKLDTAALINAISGETSDFNLMIINPENQRITAGQAIPVLDEMTYAEIESGSQVIRQDKIQYLVATTESVQSDWKYILVANLAVFQSSLLQVRNLMLIFIGSFLVLGTVVSILLARRNYSPIRQLVTRAAQLSSSKTRESVNEFQQLETAISDIYREKESYSRLLDRQRLQMQTVVLNRLIKGRIPTSEQACEMLAVEGIELKGSHFVMAMLAIEDFGALLNAEEADPSTVEAVELSQLIVANVLEELYGEQMSAKVFEADNFIACLISLDPQQAGMAQISEILHRGLAAIRQYFSIVISAGVSDIHEGMIGTGRCYQEAQEVLEITRTLGAPGEITLFDSRRVSNSRLAQSAMHLETRRLMLNYLLVEDYESAEIIALDFVKSLEAASAPAAYRRIAQSGLIEDLSAALDALCGEVAELRHPQAESILADLLVSDSLSDFRQLILAFFAELVAIRTEKDQLFQHDVKLSQIVDFIDKNLNDVNLSVAGVAKAVGLSVSQVARLMRGKLGQGTLDYIQKSRVELAKKLLTETDLNISEISRRVGYENFRTMNSIFKKVEGITGTQYRENTRKSRPE